MLYWYKNAFYKENRFFYLPDWNKDVNLAINFKLTANGLCNKKQKAEHVSLSLWYVQEERKSHYVKGKDVINIEIFGTIIQRILFCFLSETICMGLSDWKNEFSVIDIMFYWYLGIFMITFSFSFFFLLCIRNSIDFSMFSKWEKRNRMRYVSPI